MKRLTSFFEQPYIPILIVILYVLLGTRVYVASVIDPICERIYRYLQAPYQENALRNVLFLIEYSILLVCVRRYLDARSLRPALSIQKAGRHLMLGVAMGLLYYILFMGLKQDLGLHRRLFLAYWYCLTRNPPQALLLLLLSAMMIAVAEESIFRGYLLERLRSLIGDWGALVNTSYLFMLYHWAAVDTTSGVFALTGAAFLLGLLYLLTDDLWACIAAHGTIDFLYFSTFESYTNHSGQVVFKCALAFYFHSTSTNKGYGDIEYDVVAGFYPNLKWVIALSVVILGLLLYRVHQVRSEKSGEATPATLRSLKSRFADWLMGKYSAFEVMPAVAIGFTEYLFLEFSGNPVNAGLLPFLWRGFTLYLLRPLQSLLILILLAIIWHEGRRLLKKIALRL
jgi:membrane protease YdiL (CAAX protease family)